MKNWTTPRCAGALPASWEVDILVSWRFQSRIDLEILLSAGSSFQFSKSYRLGNTSVTVWVWSSWSYAAGNYIKSVRWSIATLSRWNGWNFSLCRFVHGGILQQVPAQEHSPWYKRQKIHSDATCLRSARWSWRLVRESSKTIRAARRWTRSKGRSWY